VEASAELSLCLVDNLDDSFDVPEFAAGVDDKIYLTDGYFPPPRGMDCACGISYQADVPLPLPVAPIEVVDAGVVALLSPGISSLPIQEVVDTFTVDQTEYSLSSLSPCDEAEVVVADLDGVNEEPGPQGVSCLEGFVDGAIVVMYLNDDSVILQGVIKPETGPDITLIAADTINRPNQLVTLQADDYDPAYFEQFTLDDPVEIPTETRRHLTYDNVTSSSLFVKSGQRDLQSNPQCNNDIQDPGNVYKIVDFAVLYDSTFCSRAGGTHNGSYRYARIIVREANRKNRVSPPLHQD
jgi:hypothetical protein